MRTFVYTALSVCIVVMIAILVIRFNISESHPWWRTVSICQAIFGAISLSLGIGTIYMETGSAILKLRDRK